MLEAVPPYAIWSVWKMLGFSPRLFFLMLCVTGVYVVYSSVLTIARVRGIPKAPPPEEDVALMLRSLAILHRRISRLRQFVGAGFYLFGVVLFVAFQREYITIGHSTVPIGYEILRDFMLEFVFAANVFFVFLVVHTAQWVASEQVDSCTSRLSAHTTQTLHP